jgi:hypothetical protein
MELEFHLSASSGLVRHARHLEHGPDLAHGKGNRDAKVSEAIYRRMSEVVIDSKCSNRTELRPRTSASIPSRALTVKVQRAPKRNLR